VAVSGELHPLPELTVQQTFPNIRIFFNSPKKKILVFVGSNKKKSIFLGEGNKKEIIFLVWGKQKNKKIFFCGTKNSLELRMEDQPPIFFLKFLHTRQHVQWGVPGLIISLL
jgi:hypothetical protein